MCVLLCVDGGWVVEPRNLVHRLSGWLLGSSLLAHPLTGSPFFPPPVFLPFGTPQVCNASASDTDRTHSLRTLVQLGHVFDTVVGASGSSTPVDWTAFLSANVLFASSGALVRAAVAFVKRCFQSETPPAAGPAAVALASQSLVQAAVQLLARLASEPALGECTPFAFARS